MRVNTEELNRQAAELRRVAAKINDIEDTVQRASRVLSRDRFGERFRSPLNSMARSITGRAEELIRMSAALSQISALYERTETRIIDEAEHANVHYEHDNPFLYAIPAMPWINWRTRPTYPRPIPVRPAVEDDVLVVDGLPTLDVIGWEEAVENVFGTPDEEPRSNVIPIPGPDITDEMRDALENVFDTPETEPHCNVIPIPGPHLTEEMRDALEEPVSGSHTDRSPQPVITDEMRDALRDAIVRRPGTGYIPPVEIPIPDPIDVSQVFTNRGSNLADLIGTGRLMDHADTILGTTGLIDWTPWDA